MQGVEMIMEQELTIKQDNELFDLETLITEGVDSRVPIEIEFPNGKKAGALIKPITTADFQTIYGGEPTEILIKVLELGLLDKEGQPISRNLIEAMPMGLPNNIFKQICTISGLELNQDDIKSAREVMGDMELFP